ncbi:3-methyl-2-oxobutanoate hydroxymethyltransferase [bacterium]|nr:3-methyl-2-oxobutanoate hydroxymethyltransferase [bacterium]
MAKQVTTETIRKFYETGKKITMLTCYDYSTGKMLDASGIDCVLVGDSLAMVALGYDTTHKIGIDEMKIFTQAVARGVHRAFTIVDMPFMSYHTSIEDAAKNAGELIRCGAKAVKIEGGNDFIISVVKHLTNIGIPVVAHLGFTPQFMHALGGYKIQGKNFDKTMRILEQAKELEKAGAFMLVLEMVPSEAAEFITKNINIPTIGIGAGVNTSGQVLVIDDILGKYSNFTPKFARKYADICTTTESAIKNYINDVENSTFPCEDEIFKLEKDESEKLNDHSYTYNK